MSKPHTIQHFSHNHPLTEVNVVGTYTCDGCKLYGDGKTYRCNDCDYDLHEYCARCPQTLVNTWHALDHELSLINGPTHATERGCYVCRVYIQGMFYKCKHCSFESHPLCTHRPMHAPSPDATVTKQRSLHDHSGAGQPSFPHHYGQGNSYGYSHMGPSGPYVHGGGHHHQQHQPHQHQHHQHQHQHPYMNPGSPKADPNTDSSKGKKKNREVFGALRAGLAVTGVVAANLLVATVTDGALNEEQFLS